MKCSGIPSQVIQFEQNWITLVKCLLICLFINIQALGAGPPTCKLCYLCVDEHHFTEVQTPCATEEICMGPCPLNFLIQITSLSFSTQILITLSMSPAPYVVLGMYRVPKKPDSQILDIQLFEKAGYLISGGIFEI